MNGSVAHKLIESHLLDGNMNAGEEIALRIDQTLAQDATGTLVMLEFEALGVPKVKTELSRSTSITTWCRPTSATRTMIVPPLGGAQVGRVVLKAGQRSVTSGPHAAVRRARKDTARVRLAYVRCRVAGHVAIGTGGLDVAMAMAASPITSRCRRSGACDSRASCPTGSAPRT